MYESYKINIRTYHRGVPFMDMISLTGFSHLEVTLEGLNAHHCDLLITFMSILSKSNLTRMGQNNTRSSHIIAKSTKVSQFFSRYFFFEKFLSEKFSSNIHPIETVQVNPYLHSVGFRLNFETKSSIMTHF